MANAGNHHDTRLLKKMITEGKLIKIYPDDHPVAKKIKLRFNQIVGRDQPSNYRYNGKTYLTHSAWKQIDRTLIWVNQLRLRYWFFNPIQRS